MTTNDRNWYVGMGTILAVAAIIVWSVIWLATPADGGVPAQAGPVVRVMVGGGHGSGVHIGDGYILTAEHVVARSMSAPKDKPQPVTIRDDQGGEVVAKVLWASPESDIALLKIVSTQDAAEIACRPLIVGEAVMAHGNPASIQFARSWGRISTAEQEIGRWPRAVAMDAAAMRGSSGGPVFDEAGLLIGIVVGAANPATGYAGFSFVVPALAICDLLATS